MQSLYIFHATGTNYYKIGYTEQGVDQRLMQLQTASPHKLRVFLARQLEHADELESTLHDRYEAYRHTGEWFVFTPEEAARVGYEVRDICLRTAALELKSKLDDLSEGQAPSIQGLLHIFQGILTTVAEVDTEGPLPEASFERAWQIYEMLWNSDLIVSEEIAYAAAYISEDITWEAEQ